MTKITMKATIAALLLTAGPASASCLISAAPAVLQPRPGEVYGCPVYVRVHNGKFWFSVFSEPFNNTLYGFLINDDQPKTPDWATAISVIATQNATLFQQNTLFQTDMALTGITFTPTTQQFASPDDPVFIITNDIRQGF
jgi:hypothetical protein